MTYAQAIQFLYGLRWFGTKLGLANTIKLAELAGNPHHRLCFIHVAGTNGKGSTCAMLESIYRAAGLSVGLFTSPHLVSFAERIQINRRLIPEAEVARLVAQIQPWLQQFPAEGHPTFFEVVTVMALRYFAEQRCDLVIWETGLGGRLDATNIVTPLASIITNIQYDHQQWLGDTLASIAAEKAGIIKPGVPVITATDEPEALEVIEQTALERKAPLFGVRSRAVAQTAQSAVSQVAKPASRPLGKARPDPEAHPCTGFEAFRTDHGPGSVATDFDALDLDNLDLSLPGQHQRLNAATALAAIQVLQPRIPVPAEALRAGLAQVQWPGRMQLVPTASGRTFLLDGAHNVAGAEILAAELCSQVQGTGCHPSHRSQTGSQLFSLSPAEGARAGVRGNARSLPAHLQKLNSFSATATTFILGILRDKDWAEMCQILAPLARRILLVPVQSERSAAPQDLAAACRRANASAEILACSCLAEALRQSSADPFVVIAGSLYLIGEAMELLGISASSSASERRLNEWTQPASEALAR